MTYSYLPIDVGFDLRLHDYEIVLPDDASEVRFMSGTRESSAAGDHESLRTSLRDAGYSCR